MPAACIPVMMNFLKMQELKQRKTLKDCATMQVWHYGAATTKLKSPGENTKKNGAGDGNNATLMNSDRKSGKVMILCFTIFYRMLLLNLIHKLITGIRPLLPEWENWPVMKTLPVICIIGAYGMGNILSAISENTKPAS